MAKSSIVPVLAAGVLASSLSCGTEELFPLEGPIGVERAALDGPLTLYSDSLGAGFSDWSWCPLSLLETSPVHSGARSVGFEPDAWCAVRFRHSAGVPIQGNERVE